ncbi:unnamed protein product [Caenorhabditis angaria]|uniref:G-protein coupled receptors family 1 profile domain-containing protein n=1 Tax=Caenorhabditis angaria TaxID=860376 RepID=A0A9P1IT69_9PELO|nr:unnamed protein product [Caenorhabditis angaria]
MDGFINYFRAYHSIASLYGCALNALLVYVVLTKSPKSIKSYGVLVINFSITDFLICIFNLIIMQRIIICGDGVAYISIGPCSLHSARFCFISFVLILHFYTHSFWLLLISFSYRYYVMIKSEPKMWKTQLLVCIFYLPSLFRNINIHTQNVPEESAKKMVMAYYPSYDVSQLTVTAVATVWDFTALYCCIHVVGVSVPIAFAIVTLRGKILKKLSAAGQTTSQRSKQLQLQFLKALTFQACIPVFYLWGGLCFMIQQWNIINNALPQYFCFCFFILVPILNPMSSFIFITPYRNFFISNLKRKFTTTSTKISVAHSSDFIT